MMNHALTAILISLGSCAAVPVATGEPPVPPAKPPCQGDIVYVTDDEPTDCDVNPPQRLDMLITDTDNYQAICDHHGGYILWVEPRSAHCADIDY